jgi:hypothetical protein
MTYTDDDYPSVEKLFVGVPLLLGMEGSTVRLNDEWLLTVGHNAPILAMQLRDVVYHPTCDVALIRSQGISTTSTGLVYPGEKVTHVGYPSAQPLTANVGQYVGDVIQPDGCQYSATTASVMGGMSGGGVFNSEGELVGVSVGYSKGQVVWDSGEKLNDPTIFISLAGIEDWLSNTTGGPMLQR